MDSVVQRMMMPPSSPYRPVHNNERDVEEAKTTVGGGIAEKRAAGHNNNNNNNNVNNNKPSLETVPEEENTMTKERVTIGDRYDGSDADVDLGGSGQLGAAAVVVEDYEEGGEGGESSSLFGSLKFKKYSYIPGGAWGVNPAGRLTSTRRLVFNAPVVITLSLFFNFLLVLILGVLAWKISPPSTGGRPPDELVYTPLEDLVELQAQNYWVGLAWGKEYPESPYQGWPTDEIDALWDKYDDGAHVRITKEQAQKLPHMPLPVPLEEWKDEYFVSITVFHQLHCLNALRKALYPRRYNSSLVDDQGRVDYGQWHHVDHCVELVRQALVCRPDTTARTFRWHPAGSQVLHHWTTHTCRNFDPLMAWASAHTVPGVRSRARVAEGGRIEDLTGTPLGPGAEELALVRPEDWGYTAEDIWDERMKKALLNSEL